MASKFLNDVIGRQHSRMNCRINVRMGSHDVGDRSGTCARLLVRVVGNERDELCGIYQMINVNYCNKYRHMAQ